MIILNNKSTQNSLISPKIQLICELLSKPHGKTHFNTLH